MVIDHGKIIYAEKEPGGDVTVHAYLSDWTRRWGEPSVIMEIKSNVKV